MKEVLGAVLADHLAFLEERGIAVERWLGPAPIAACSADRLRDRMQRVDWAHFAPLCDRYWELLEPLKLNEAFADYLLAKPDGWAGGYRRIFGMAVTPKLLVTVVMRISGIASFRCVQAMVKSLGPNDVQVSMTINPGFAHCEAFFRYTGMMLERLPRLLGLSEATVDVTITPRHGHYLVKLPPHRVRPLSWIVGIFRYLQGAGTMFRELANRESELKQNYDELLRTQAALAAAHQDLEARVVERTQDFLRAKEEAEAANRSKTDFLANVSHELRTPLTSILGFAELLGNPAMAEDRRRYATDVVNRNARQLLSLVNDLLDIGRIESNGLQLSPAPFDVGTEVRNVVGSFAEQAAKRRLDLRCEISPSVPASIVSDAVRFRQVLTNVVGNAVKYSEGCTVEVRVDMREPLLRIEVEDHGPGIDASLHERIFQPFVQGDSSSARADAGGAGLGLTIARRLACALGGNLELVRSSPGQGSVFAFTISPAMAP